MRVKELADLAGTTVRTIRYYHQLGLLSVPEPGVSWRSYGFAHLTRLMRIRWLVESGVPLADVPHMLRPPGSTGERWQAEEDLTAVLAGMDERIADLGAQRDRVAGLLQRVRTQGRFSPLPESVVCLYAALLARPLEPAVRTAVTRERELMELASYRGALPRELEDLVGALCDAHLDDLCGLWGQINRIDQQSRAGMTPEDRARLDEVVDRVLALGLAAEPAATRALLRRAAELDRPVVHAAVRLAYPSPAYRHVVESCIGKATTLVGERS